MVTLTAFDIILILILFFFFTTGFVYGFIGALGTVVSLVLGLWAAHQYYLGLSLWLSSYISWLSPDWLALLSFIVIALAAFKLAELFFYAIERLLKILFIIPFLKTFNRLFGALFGIGTGALFLGLFLHAISQYDLPFINLEQYLADSRVANFLIRIGEILSPLVPALIDKVKALF